MFSVSLILFVMFYASNQTTMLSKVISPDITGAVQNGGAPSSSRAVRATATCILPAYPDHGTYDVLNVNNARPGQSYNTLLLSVQCERGYGMENSNTPYGNSSLVLCDQGVWYHAIPKCVRFCKLAPHPSVDYLCHTPDVGFKPCDGYLAPGTLVNPVCKSPEYSPNSPIILDMECVQGQWNYVAVCKEDCGRVLPKGGMGLITGGTYTRHGQVPWHVGLYRKTSTPYEQICGGSLVSSKVVISAAHCFVSRNPSDYGVASGKIYRLWDDKGDVNAQKSDVKEIKIPRLYQGAVGHFGVDIAVIVLATPFILNPFVRPVCLNFDTSFDKWQLQDRQLGKVAGWGLTTADGAASPILQVVDLPFINEDTCINSVPPYFRPYITGDKFCAGYTNGTALCRGDSGGGLAFSEKEQGKDRFYLRGIVSTAARSDDQNICNDHTFTAFTRIVNHQDFIKNVIAVSERKTCQGADCEGNCANGSRECKPVTNTDKINPSTAPYVSDTPDSTNVTPGKCAAIHPSMTSAKTGQKAFDKCIEYQEKYVYPCENSGTLKARRGNHCLHDSVELIIGGTDTKPHEFPHMVLLGFGDDERSINWQCGGSIISEKYILTVAHCTSTGAGGLVKYVLIGAQTRSDANDPANVYKVKRIIRPPVYQSTSKYNDIALLETEEIIPLSQYVVPACLHVGDPVDDEKVLATGWGVTEFKGNFSEVLQKVILQKFSTAECGNIYSASRQVNQGFVPEFQICYGDRTQAKDTCTGDSGGPIQIKSKRLHCMYVIVGVTSFGRGCGIPNNPSIYTRVQGYLPWIENIVWPSTAPNVPETPDPTKILTGQCAAIDPSMTSRKTGQKAFDKCIEYQEKYVYPCENSGTLKARRGNHCLHDSVELIIGGTDTKPHEFPHMVLLGFGDDERSINWQCGGSIISEKYILTVAHCTSTGAGGLVKYVLIGAQTRSDANDPANVYKVKRIIRPPVYQSTSKYNDIALLETEEIIPLSQYVVPACLHVGDPVDDEKVLATGWGVTEFKGNFSEVLQKVILQKFSTAECGNIYSASRQVNQGFVPEFQICYGDRTQAKDTCTGDSGGPIQIKSKRLHCMYVIVGVTSFGRGCGIPNNPSIYTRVQGYLPWIENIVWPSTAPNVPETPDPTKILPGQCAAIDPSMTSRKTGQKAFDKCVEYQEKYVYPCENSGTLKARRGNHCLHDSVELIVGGTDTKPHEFPHMVMLGFVISGQSIRWLCGGSIISEKYILSAGQCASVPKLEQVRYILIGAHTRSDAKDPAKVYEVKRVITYPDYQPSKYNNDILLLETEKTIPLSQYVVPACLHVGEHGNVEKVLATGWGRTESRGNNSEIMQKVILQKFGTAECNVTYAPQKTLFDPATHICYGDRAGGKDACVGDSGGPIQIKSNRLHCMYVIVGVTSFGRGCGTNEPALYTRVESYVPWIESIVWPSNEETEIVFPGN